MARNLANKGAIIISWDINAESNGETVRIIKEASGTAYAYTVDVR